MDGLESAGRRKLARGAKEANAAGSLRARRR